MPPLTWPWRRSSAPEALPPSAGSVTAGQAPAPSTAAPATVRVAAAEPLPGREQEPAPREVLSSDPEARDLFLAGIQALETMARWRRDAGSAG